MHIKIDIHFEFPHWAKRLIIHAGVPGMMLFGAATAVYADSVIVPNQFKDGDTLSAEKMNKNFSTLQDAINNANPECPRGYTRDSGVPGIVSCKNGVDEVVKVGIGASAFWIDRYEASVWTTPNGQATTNIGDNDGDIGTAGLPRNGQFIATAGPVYALSVSGVKPARYVTWFQAMEACAASGKRLPDGQEWLRAARGTSDATGCRLSGLDMRLTGNGADCQSVWGAQDMIGNLWELTAEWYAGVGDGTAAPVAWPDTVGGSYAGDGTWNIASSAAPGNGGPAKGLPAAAWRGGDWGSTVFAGVFSIFLGSAPSYWYSGLGFRCVVPNR